VKENNQEYSLGSLAELLGLTLEGDPDAVVSGIATLATAQASDLSFYHNSAYFSDLQNTSAAVVILSKDAAPGCSVNKLLADNPYLAYARASRLFEESSVRQALVHPAAVIHESATLGNDVSIGANVVVEANVKIGDRSVIGANTVIGKNSVLGNDANVSPNVSIYSEVSVGCNVIIHSGVVVGSDGFGFARDGEKQVKIAQLGGVTIGDDVEIGAGSTIDRGALENTLIGDGVKIDNQVQIAHNVRIGENTVICGCSAIAGSSNIGKNCIIAGAVGIINHIDIVDGVTVTAMSLVNKSITRKGVYSSGTGLSETAQWKKNIVHFKHLDKLNSRLKALEMFQKKAKKN
jgi:UDP-3-O-[3-hydroxymyristoyl] glucosamine N-acyltransferase